MAGTQLHEGKTRVWNRAGDCPPDVADLGDEVWSPEAFIHALAMERFDEERPICCGRPSIGCGTCSVRGKFWCDAPGPGVTTSFAQCHPVSPRAYAEGHDAGMMETMRFLLGGLTGDEAQKHIADAPDEVGWLGTPVCKPHVSCCVLGVLGRIIADDCPAFAHCGSQGHGERG